MVTYLVFWFHSAAVYRDWFQVLCSFDPNLSILQWNS